MLFEVEPLRTLRLIEQPASFCFLNVTNRLGSSPEKVDWCPAGVSRLWRYNLHYFDYLRQADYPADCKLELMRSWVKNHPQGSRPGWEPFTTSLRIVNWVFLLHTQTRVCEEDPLIRSLFEQLLWLEKNDERHILANHYFENLKALLFGGVFFSGRDAGRWLRRATDAIAEQLEEQTLADGGHYERAPQYHCLMVENYLDIVNLVQSNAQLFDDDFLERVRSAASVGLNWLNAVTFPDGTIPLFNDSAFGSAPTSAELQTYASKLFGYDCGENQGVAQIFEKPASGLYGVRGARDMFIIDCGEIGPSYQPGHTHCDFLSYELMLADQRIVVDTGVYEYEPGEMRHLVRSTRAHNTVMLDGAEQSEIWGEFRVARTAKKLAAKIVREGVLVRFAGEFTGFPTVPGEVRHQRSVDISLNPESTIIESLIFRDVITGRGKHLIENRVHLHPDIACSRIEEGAISLQVGSNALAQIVFDPDLAPCIEAAVYCPELGKKLSSAVVVFRMSAELPFEMCYQIRVTH